MFDQPPRTFEELVELFDADIRQTATWLWELILDAFLGKPSFKLEGTGKHMRHIKFAAPAVDRVTELVDLMRIPVDRRT